MKLSHSLVGGVAVGMMFFLPAAAQEPAQPLPETRIVLRVSDKFIQRLVGVHFQSDQPINSNAGGVLVAGSAHVAGKFRVVLHESTTESDFDVHVHGDIQMQLTATRRPVVVQAHGSAPFTVRRRVVHQGDDFSAQAITIGVNNHFTLDDICSFRGGLTGAITRQVARPFARRGLADGDRQADTEIRGSVDARAGDLAGQAGRGVEHDSAAGQRCAPPDPRQESA